jgi:1,4-dihydroxy-2-naphthoyl-CoA hydrolase
MRIWSQDYTIDQLKKVTDKFMTQHIGIELIELGDDFLKGKMPVDERTKTPYGILHGGASCVLAESLGSTAAYLCVDQTKQRVVGLEINANHLKSMKEGYVVGVAKPIHIGRSVQVWEIRIYDEQEIKLVCISRLTIKVLDKL